LLPRIWEEANCTAPKVESLNEIREEKHRNNAKYTLRVFEEADKCVEMTKLD
jgi:hypothetical protein